MKIVALLAGVLFAGCAVDGPDVGSSVSAVQSANRLSSNALTSNRLSSNRLSSNRLSSNRLSSNGLASTTVDDLADNADGRELLSYLIGCALPAGTSITASDSAGAEYTFAGSIGLAPEWAERAPTLSERRWVSACLLARTNAFGVTVQLSLAGSHPALATGPGEREAFPLFEGAFYGDLWADDPRPMDTCQSAFATTTPTISTFPLRQCSVPTGDGSATRCGFTPTGVCESTCDIDAGTCTTNGVESDEVIFVYLQAP